MARAKVTSTNDGQFVSLDDYNELWEALEAEIELRETAEADVAKYKPFEGRAKELGDQLRGLSHRKAFDKLADELKIKKDLRDDLFALSGWQAEADEVDAKAMRKHFEGVVESRKWALEPEDGGGDEAAAEKPRKRERIAAEEDAGRGPATPPPGKFRVKASDVADPDWMKANQDRFAAAAEDGSLEYV